MSLFKVEVKGLAADRYRAYAIGKLLRRPTVADHVARHERKLPPLGKGARIRYDGEFPVQEGDIGKGPKFVVSAPKGVMLTRVVLYQGPIESEIVVGSVDVDSSGKIEIEMIEPVDPVDEVVDEVVGASGTA